MYVREFKVSYYSLYEEILNLQRYILVCDEHSTV
jgi:hypothetical protein